MRVLFVTSECVPFFKLGGLADVSYALPVALRRLGVQMSVVMPYYAAIKHAQVTCVGQMAVDFAGKRELVFLFQTTILGTHIPIFLIRHPRLNEYFSENLAETFAFYSASVVRAIHYIPEVLGGPFDIIHCHDWHTALVPLLLGENNKWQKEKGKREKELLEATRAKTILTIHNLLYEGETGISIMPKLGLPRSIFHVFHTPLGPAIKLLEEGLEYADVITTVSPTYARELMAKGKKRTYEVFKRRSDRIVGILNGIDPTIWDPASDAALPVRYTKANVFSAKREIKSYLQKAVGLPASDVPLFGFIGRLEERQKGTDILRLAVKLLPASAFQLVILGTGRVREVNYFESLSRVYPHVAFINTFDERLARRMYAGADVMLVPSKFEPCGLTQMIAMRYGTIPLVRKTGGLADSVKDGQNGIVFTAYQASALADAMKRVIELFTWEKKHWQGMVKNALTTDFRWTKSARAYQRLYENL